MINLSKEQTKTKKKEIAKFPKDFSLIDEGYNEESAINEARRCFNCPNPTCMLGCPIHNEIPKFIHAITEHKFDEAYNIISLNSCLPEICGKVCPHEKQCEGHCIRSKNGEPVAIGSLERFIGKYHRENYVKKEIKKNPHSKNICVIGSGPASLSFSLKTMQKGHKITIFEKESVIGGAIITGIPDYRLDHKALDFIVQYLKDNGVNFLTNKTLGKDIKLQDLISKFDYVFLGLGSTVSKKMNIEGEKAKGIYSSFSFLKDTNLKSYEVKNNMTKYGENILVVGGGNAAIDVARNAIRLPGVKSVNIVYRRTENEMPAYITELNEAKEEGVTFNTLINPVRFILEDDRVIQTECAVMELGEPDESGRRRPIESNKEHIFFKTDSVIMALGFDNDAKNLTDNLIETDKWSSIVCNEDGLTSINNVFSGGDVVTGPKTVVLAMKAGIEAAKKI